MRKAYEIPLSEMHHLGIGSWVEIFEAYGSAEGDDAIQVRSMRVGGKLHTFPAMKRKPSKGLRPHEGQIAFIAHAQDRIRFGLR